MNAAEHAAQLRRLAEHYSKLPESGLNADDFNARLRRDGVSALDAAAMLRDLYGLGLQECMAIHQRYLTAAAADHSGTNPAI